MKVLRDKNGKVEVDEQLELSPEHRKDMERLAAVADDWTDLAFGETPTVAVSALIGVLTRVLVLADGNPINEARILGQALQVQVRELLEELHGQNPFLN
jgi:hypothetical protein